jgi:DNA repair exonuclease SbcCD nuclease subunit
MIKCIIHCGDIHIRNFLRRDEYSDQLVKFIEKCKEITTPYNKEECRILVCGDLVHQKNTVSNELFTFTNAFIKELEKVCKVVVIAGNHDLMVDNRSRQDTISTIFETGNFSNTFFFDSLLSYESGYIIDDNITWVLYSIYDDFKSPDISEAKKEHPDNKVIGLFHGSIVGSSLFNGTIIEHGVNGKIFEDCEVVMAADIHKRQVVKAGDVDIVYPGSLIQQDYGETITQHGFCVWDVDTLEHKFVDLESDYGYYDIRIASENDVDDDVEQLINL